MADPEKLFIVNVVTPDGLIFSHHCSLVEMRAIDGQRSIMYNHLPILTPLTIGEIRVKRGREMNETVNHIAISGGYFEFSNNVATIIADSAERSTKINLSRAEAAKKRAQSELEKAKTTHDQRSLERAQVALRRAVNRISVYNSDN
ncbi:MULTISPECIES: F0F1 ATP synthase subunit epsilon [unclassified Lactobacillus]|uniref:F0F1 ATP synthase subunit epsilon n=1 Tax=unclassified Lactobacillus TaxID=2620435 RepID=UPI000EFCC5A3|nr:MULTISPECIES: F0F1 ATP synthase subunit epsilon [unclassified Lactobacillus]RMC40871.1 F0F1 ATP synthase subunit epsilon [Lactobacillus sp. ESL0237]RMC44626.1 F0F1 ATP synthase subunit epsilon [Lactobacillus sp. ESL0234]RMC45933.1 F0F1 ATP synthase subunit epsilon [Lactobacillus sp. ESL0236]RMC46270.1 F0F1 ATP synthase subunit epsilon [Lactobacillus sp. ESL0230]RMC51334.1 F0F1 ATP synthase subunit epsilon [Lactobacillus sp. ESL0225]